jgi:membrane protein DedA with SNARE-associated domain
MQSNIMLTSPSFENIIHSYGYAGIFIGTLIWGEIALIMGAFLASEAYLYLPLVILSSFLATLIGDQLLFFLGHFAGKKILDSRPRWSQKTTRVNELLFQHRNLIILFFRFFYGIRAVIPLVIGMSKVKTIQFAVLNMAGALIWAVVFGIGGYLAGNALALLIGHIQHYEKYVLGGIILLGVLIWIIRHGFRGRKDKKEAQVCMLKKS